MNACVDAGDGMTSNPSSLTDLKGQVAMSITLGMVLDDGTKETTGGGMMSNNALLGGDEGNRRFLHIFFFRNVYSCHMVVCLLLREISLVRQSIIF